MNLARKLVHTLLGRIESGHIELSETYSGGKRLNFGDPFSERRASLEVHDPEVYSRLVRSKSIALGTTYAEGLWDSPDVLSFLQVVTREIGRGDSLRRKLAPALAPFQRIGSLKLLNTKTGARENIASHYDAGNDMFEMFLDKEYMMYSCAYFEHDGQSLEEAQAARLERICEQLELQPSDHLLEIGSGWGGLAVHAARRFGCKVTTTTISTEQLEYTRKRVEEAGVADRVTVLGSDYRDLTGTYDKLVSIEMVEAVGWEWFDTYFRKCSRLLAPDGLFFLQAIVVDDAIYETEKRTRSFANELIFPGGCLPSVNVIQNSIANETDLRTIELEDISTSYVRTLNEWKRRFETNEEQIAELGYDENFRRLWHLYMAMSAAGFSVARIRDVQMVFAKPRYESRIPGKPSAVEAAA